MRYTRSVLQIYIVLSSFLLIVLSFPLIHSPQNGHPSSNDGDDTDQTPSMSCLLFGDAGCNLRCAMLCSVYKCKYWDPRCEGVFCNCNEIFDQDAYFPLNQLEKGASFRKALAYRFLRSPICLELDSYLTEHPETKERVMDFLYNVEGHGNSLKRQFIKQFPELNGFLRKLRPRPVPRNSIEEDISKEVLKQGVDNENTDKREWQPLYPQHSQLPNKYVDSDQNLDRIVDLVQCINNKDDLLRTFDKLKESNEQPLYDNIAAYFAIHGLTLPDGTEILKPTRNPQKINDILENDGVVNAIKQKIRLGEKRPSNFEDIVSPSEQQSDVQHPILSLEEAHFNRRLNQPAVNYYHPPPETVPFEYQQNDYPRGGESVIPLSNTYHQPIVNNFTPFTVNNVSPNINSVSSNAYIEPNPYSNSYLDPLLDQDNDYPYIQSRPVPSRINHPNNTFETEQPSEHSNDSAPAKQDIPPIQSIFDSNINSVSRPTIVQNPTSVTNEKLYEMNDKEIPTTPTHVDSHLLWRPNIDEESENDTEQRPVSNEQLQTPLTSSSDGQEQEPQNGTEIETEEPERSSITPSSNISSESTPSNEASETSNKDESAKAPQTDSNKIDFSMIDSFNPSFKDIFPSFGTNTDDENKTKHSEEALSNSRMPFENLMDELKSIHPTTEIQTLKIPEQQYIPSDFDNIPKVTENEESSKPSSNDVYSGKTLLPSVFDDLVSFESDEYTPSGKDQSVGDFISSDEIRSGTQQPLNSPTFNAIEPIEANYSKEPLIENSSAEYEAESNENPRLKWPKDEDFETGENNVKPVTENVEIEPNSSVEQQPISKSDDENHSWPKIDELNFDETFTNSPFSSGSIDTADLPSVDSKQQWPTDIADQTQLVDNFSSTGPMKHSYTDLVGGEKSTASGSFLPSGLNDSQVWDSSFSIPDEISLDFSDPNSIENKPSMDSSNLNIDYCQPKASDFLDIIASPHTALEEYDTDESNKFKNISTEIVTPKPQDENPALKEPTFYNDSQKNSSDLIENDNKPITDNSIFDQFDNLFDNDNLKIPEIQNSKNPSNEEWESVFQNSNPLTDEFHEVEPQDTDTGSDHHSLTNTDLSNVSIKPEPNADKAKHKESDDINFESGNDLPMKRIESSIENFEQNPNINYPFQNDYESTSLEPTPNDTHSKHDTLTDNSILDENSFSSDQFFADISRTPLMPETESVVDWDNFDFGEFSDIDSLFDTMKDSWFDDDTTHDTKSGFFSNNGIVTPTEPEYNQSESTDNTSKHSSPIDNGLENEWDNISTPIVEPSNISGDFNLDGSKFGSFFDENDDPSESSLLFRSSDSDDNNFNDDTTSSNFSFSSQQQNLHRGVPNALLEKFNTGRPTLSESNASPSSVPSRNLPDVPDIIRSKFGNGKSSVPLVEAH